MMGVKAKADERLKGIVLKYLKEHNTMTIATTKDNIPWAASVFYANDGFTLYYLSDPGTRHQTNITHQSTVSVTVNEDYRDHKEVKGIQMEGRAELVSADEELARAAAIYVEKYPYVSAYLKLMMTPFPKAITFLEKFLGKLPGIPDFTTPFPARFYKIVPTKIYWIDNEKSFGKREELIP